MSNQKPKHLQSLKLESWSFQRQKIVDLTGELKIFCLMGDVDQVQSKNKYVICWFDDAVDDFYEAFRRLSGVTFPSGVSCSMDKRNKRTYNAVFQAKHGKLK